MEIVKLKFVAAILRQKDNQVAKNINAPAKMDFMMMVTMFNASPAIIRVKHAVDQLTTTARRVVQSIQIKEKWVTLNVPAVMDSTMMVPMFNVNPAIIRVKHAVDHPKATARLVV